MAPHGVGSTKPIGFTRRERAGVFARRERGFPESAETGCAGQAGIGRMAGLVNGARAAVELFDSVGWLPRPFDSGVLTTVASGPPTLARVAQRARARALGTAAPASATVAIGGRGRHWAAVPARRAASDDAYLSRRRM